MKRSLFSVALIVLIGFGCQKKQFDESVAAGGSDRSSTPPPIENHPRPPVVDHPSSPPESMQLKVDGAWVQVLDKQILDDGETQPVRIQVIDTYFVPQISPDARRSICLPEVHSGSQGCLAPQIHYGGLELLESPYLLPTRRSGRLVWTMPIYDPQISDRRLERVRKAVEAALHTSQFDVIPAARLLGSTEPGPPMIHDLSFAIDGERTDTIRERQGVVPHLTEEDSLPFDSRALLPVPFSGLRAWVPASNGSIEQGHWLDCLDFVPVSADRPFCWDAVNDGLFERVKRAAVAAHRIGVHFRADLGGLTVDYEFRIEGDGHVVFVSSAPASRPPTSI